MALSISSRIGSVPKKSNSDHSLNSFVEKSINNDKQRVKRGERSESIIINDRSIQKTYCKPFFKNTDIRNIDYQMLQRFVDRLTDRDLSSSSIKRILVLVSKALKVAAQEKVIQAIPIFPEIRLKQKPRGWFSPLEYQHLLKECIRHEKLKTKVRSQFIKSELRRYIVFMINTFLRPSDSRMLRHRHVEVIRTQKTRYLRISTDFSKTIYSPVISMPLAVDVYLKQKRFHQLRSMSQSEDFVFLPQYQNRKFAYELLRRQFTLVCQSAGLQISSTGDKRSVYSLRHTAIMNRLLESDKVDLVTLARNARTSVEMIDRFYAKHLTAEMNIDKL